MPKTGRQFRPGRWAALRETILHEIKPDGEPFWFIVPNKRTAQLAQAAAQNASGSKRGSRQLPFPLKVRTAVEPLRHDRPDGEWKIWLTVYTPSRNVF